MSGTCINARIAVASVVWALSIAGPAWAQQRAVAPERAQTVTPPPQVVVGQDADARETREQLEELLKRLPPAVGRVLRVDPSLMGNETYLSTYPVLAAFIKQHPEIRSSPGYFLEHVGSYEFWNPSPPETREAQVVRLWREMLQFFAISGIFLTITLGLLWIIRTLVEYRRWHRTSKVHAEVHNKLMDRFTANEDLLAYIQSPVAKKFLDSAPIAIDAPPRPMGNPFSRILWSVQIGVVLAAAGLGLFIVSNNTIEEVAQPLFGVGVLALALGAGFVVSAAASFLLSRRLGFLEPPAPPREHDEVASRS
jgi:hypothetical protein